MSDIKFLKKYFSSLNELLNNDKYLEDLIKVKEILKETHSKGKKNNDIWQRGERCNSKSL